MPTEYPHFFAFFRTAANLCRIGGAAQLNVPLRHRFVHPGRSLFAQADRQPYPSILGSLQEKGLIEDGVMADRTHPSALGETSALPMPAATVVLVRQSGQAREILLLRRPAASSFAPDHWVFPGGRIDEADYEFDHATYANGPPPVEWAMQLALSSPLEAAAYPVAALREAWEETGILLAEGEPAQLHRLQRQRPELLAETRTLQSLLATAGARLATGHLRYFARWITPAWFPRRFDTRFFVTPVPADARCTRLGDELVEHRWTTPAAALRLHYHGGMRMMPPTIDTLRRLERGEI